MFQLVSSASSCHHYVCRYVATGQACDPLLQREQLQKALTEAIAGLPEELRSAFLLREYDGLSYEDIARILECPIGTVRSRIFRARDAVDRQLAPLLNHSEI